MKRFFPITLSLALTLQVSAQEIKLATQPVVNSTQNLNRKTETIEHNRPVSKKSGKGESTQSVNVIDKMFNAFSYLGMTTPLVYEPNSNMYVKVQRGESAENRGSLYMAGSKDNGKTWTDNILVYSPDDFGGDQARYPSIQVFNPNNKQNLEELDYVVLAPVLRSTSKVDEFFSGFNIISKLDNKNLIYAIVTPEENNPKFMPYSSTSQLVSNEAKKKIYLGQLLTTRDIDDTSKVRGTYGTYGYLAASYAVEEDYKGGIPEQWEAEKFPRNSDRNGEASAETSYNTNMKMDLDANGNLYAAVLNFWNQPEVIDGQKRFVGVSKSTDEGATWSNFDVMPNSVVVNFLTSLGADTAQDRAFVGGKVPYQSHGFVVTGQDEFSYIYPMIVNINDVGQGIMVHAFKKDGVWGMKKVSSFTGAQLLPLSQMVDGTLKTDDTSSRGNELQVARTLDGKNLVAKWIDLKNYPLGEDSVTSTDIFVSVYDREKGTWSEGLNVTNDVQLDKLTWLPQTLPNIQEIPVLSIITDSEFAEGTIEYFNDQFRIDLICSVASTVFHPLPVSVQEQPIITQSSLSITPNPAQDAAEIGFALTQPSFTTVSLVNALGETVKTLFKGELEPGYRGFNANLDGISTGTYYVSITTSNGSISSPVVIVR